MIPSWAFFVEPIRRRDLQSLSQAQPHSQRNPTIGNQIEAFRLRNSSNNVNLSDTENCMCELPLCLRYLSIRLSHLPREFQRL